MNRKVTEDHRLFSQQMDYTKLQEVLQGFFDIIRIFMKQTICNDPAFVISWIYLYT